MRKSALLKIGIYSPYLDTLGGGEKYMLTIAECLSQKANVDLLLDEHLFSLDIHQVLNRMEKMHVLDLSKLNLVKAPIGPGSSMIQRLFFLKKYDVLFCNTDGSIFPSSAKRSYIHFQVPFTNTNAKGLLGKIKMMTWKEAVYNSNFTKKIIEQSWPIKGRVIYPPIHTDKFKPSDLKKKWVVSVGRFFGYDKEKKHQLLIDTFKQLVDEHQIKDWSLHLAGAASEGDQSYLQSLQKSAQDYKIYFYPNISFVDLVALYGQSSIYWHAKGFGETDPKKYEHFGISTVEAMAAGCVPIVVNLGGQREIVEDEVSGCLFDSVEEWKDLTLRIMENDKLRKNLSQAAVKRSKLFSQEGFVNEIYQLVLNK